MNWTDDEPATPMQRPVVHKPRPDADVHFEFKDDGASQNPNRVRPLQRGRVANDGSGLYTDNIMEHGQPNAEAATTNPTKATTAKVSAMEEKEENEKNPLVPIATPNVNVNAKSRHNMFDPHFGFGSASQSEEFREGPGNFTNGPTATGPTKKGLTASWSLYDESPAKKENTNTTNAPISTTTTTNGPSLTSSSTAATKSFATPNPTGIKTQGNGMGGNRNAADPWDFLSADDEQQSDVIPGKTGKMGHASKFSAQQTQASSAFWDF